MIREVARDLRLEPEPQVADGRAPLEEPKVEVPKADATTAKVITSRDEAFRVIKAKAPEEPKVQVQKLETGNPKVPSKDEVVDSFTDDALQGFEDLGSRSLGRLAVGTLLVLLLLGGLASVTLQNKDRLQGLSLGVANLIAIAGEGLEVLKHRLAILTSREEEVQAPLGSKPPALQANLQGQELSNPDTEPLALADQSEPAGSLDRQKGEDPERLEDLIDARLPSPTNSYPREAIEE